MAAASKLYGCSANLAEMDFTLDLNFVLCCGSLKLLLPVPYSESAVFQENTLTEQPAGRAGTE
jgi:hypothetical protein